MQHISPLMAETWVEIPFTESLRFRDIMIHCTAQKKLKELNKKKNNLDPCPLFYIQSAARIFKNTHRQKNVFSSIISPPAGRKTPPKKHFPSGRNMPSGEVDVPPHDPSSNTRRWGGERSELVSALAPHWAGHVWLGLAWRGFDFLDLIST